MFERYDSAVPAALAHPLISFHRFLPSISPPVSSLHPSSRSIPLWRGMVIIHSDMFWCFGGGGLLAVECWHSPTHTHSLFHSLSLNPSLCLFLLSPERTRNSYCMVCRFLWQPLCESAVCLFVCLCLFICVSCKNGMMMCGCVFLLVYTYPFEQMYSVRRRINIVSLCRLCVCMTVYLCMWEFVCVSVYLVGAVWSTVGAPCHCRSGVAPLCFLTSRSSAGWAASVFLTTVHTYSFSFFACQLITKVNIKRPVLKEYALIQWTEKPTDTTMIKS